MMYDFNTKNDSFIEMHMYLKERGVENNKFFLILYDDDLQGIDPHSPCLSQEIQRKIQAEVVINYYYYIREVVRIPEAGGHIPYQLNIGNLSQAFCMELNLNIIEMLPRQNGKTVGAATRYSWQNSFSTINSEMLLFNKKLPDARKTLKKIKKIIELLPPYLKVFMDETKDTDNLNRLWVSSNNNSIDALPAPTDLASADNLGRGCTVGSLWFDEFAFLKFNSTVYEAAAPAFSKASESAKRNNAPYGILITTTPNNIDTDIGAYCHNMIEQSVVFDISWFDKTEEEIRDIIKNNSSNDFVYMEFHYQELGHDEEWFKQQCRQLNNKLIKIKRELLLEWTLSSDDAVFSEEQLEGVRQYLEESKGCFYIKNKYKFDIIRDLEEINKISWVVGIDIGGGLLSDPTAITITHPYDMKLNALFRSNTISPEDIIGVSEELVKIMPNCVLVPERTGLGITVTNLMAKNNKINKNLYYEEKERQGEVLETDPSIGRPTRKKVKTCIYGIDTTGSSRDIMINEILFTIMNESPEDINHKRLFKEISTLERNKRGKIEHRQSCHDDCLMSFLLTRYALQYGKRINRFIKYLGHRHKNNQETIDKSKNIKKNLNIVFGKDYSNATSLNINSNLLQVKPVKSKYRRGLELLKKLNN